MAKKKEKTKAESTVEELKLQYAEETKKLYDLKNEYCLNRKLEHPHLLHKYRKDIARTLTAMNIKLKQNEGTKHGK